MRYKATPEGNIPYSAEEEAQADAREVQWAFEQAEAAKTQYQRERAAAYPPIAEYLDGIVKGNQAQVQAYIDACLAVKAKYPKPAL